MMQVAEQDAFEDAVEDGTARSLTQRSASASKPAPSQDTVATTVDGSSDDVPDKVDETARTSIDKVVDEDDKPKQEEQPEAEPVKSNDDDSDLEEVKMTATDDEAEAKNDLPDETQNGTVTSPLSPNRLSNTSNLDNVNLTDDDDAAIVTPAAQGSTCIFFSPLRPESSLNGGEGGLVGTCVTVKANNCPLSL